MIENREYFVSNRINNFRHWSCTKRGVEIYNHLMTFTIDKQDKIDNRLFDE